MHSWFFNISVRSKLFFSYLVLFTLPLLLLGVISYLWISNIVMNQTQKSYENVLESAVKTVDQKFKTLETIALQLGDVSWVKEIMYMSGNTIDPEKIDVFELENSRQNLLGWKISNDFVSDMAIYFKEKDLVLSSIEKSDFQWFVEETFNVDSMNLEHWKQMLSGNLSSKIVTGLDVTSYRRQREGLLYLQSLPFSEKNDIRAAFIVFIENKSLERILEVLFARQELIAFITDEQEKVIAARNADLGNISAIQTQITHEVLNGNKNLVFNNEQYYCFTSGSEKIKWRYTVLVPRNIIMKEVDRIKIIMILIVLVSCAGGIVLSYFSAAKNYRPLLKLMDMIRDNVNEAGENDKNISRKKDNEYLWLESNIQSILRQEALLARRLEQQKPILVNTYLNKLINGSMEANQEFLKILNLLDVNFVYPYFACCVINCTSGPGNLFDNDGITSGEEGNIKIYSLENGNNAVAIVNYANQEQYSNFIDFLDVKLSGLKDEAVVAGVGKSYGNSSQIHESYNEANIALDYRMIKMSGKKVIVYDDIENLKNCYYYPIEEEYNMGNCLKSGSAEKAKETLLRILNRNLENEDISIHALRLFFFNINLTVLKIVEHMGLESTIKINPNEIYHYQTVGDMRIYLEKLFDRLCDVVNKNKKSDNAKLKEAIRQYVDENYMDGQISLNMVADKFNLSSSYFCRLFKEQFGCNYLDYVNRKRIELAKEQLSGSKPADINSISKAVGFDNASTFRRLFKKYEGISPSQYKGKQ